VVTLYDGGVDGEHLPDSFQINSEGSSAYTYDDRKTQAISDILFLTASLQALTLDSRDLSVMTEEQRRSFLQALQAVHNVWSYLPLTRTLATGPQ
jgi:hypothetical protein